MDGLWVEEHEAIKSTIVNLRSALRDSTSKNKDTNKRGKQALIDNKEDLAQIIEAWTQRAAPSVPPDHSKPVLGAESRRKMRQLHQFIESGRQDKEFAKPQEFKDQLTAHVDELAGLLKEQPTLPSEVWEPDYETMGEGAGGEINAIDYETAVDISMFEAEETQPATTKVPKLLELEWEYGMVRPDIEDDGLIDYDKLIKYGELMDAAFQAMEYEGRRKQQGRKARKHDAGGSSKIEKSRLIVKLPISVPDEMKGIEPSM